MSDRVIQFTRFGIPAIILSLLIIIGGFTGTVLQGGFNLGIDFLSGLSIRMQIADSAMKVFYTGNDRATININNNVLNIVVYRNAGVDRTEYNFSLPEYETVTALAEAVHAINGITAEVTASGDISAASIIGLNYQTDITADGILLNSANMDQNKYFDIGEIRNTLSPLGSIQIQTVGKPQNQEFIIKIQDKENTPDFNVKATTDIEKLLFEKFGSDNIVIKQTDYVGPAFSENLGSQAVLLTTLALLLILVYIWFRFKIGYAVSSVLALTHDALFMVAIIGFFRFEVNTATIAAVLTIVGYSLNNTIVIFDRIRENQILLRDKDFKKVINISIRQSLSRTIITSFTTLLAVVAIFLFATGAIKTFALNLIIGITAGTYSSLFIATGILLGWTKIAKKRGYVESDKKNADKQFSRIEESDEKPELVSETAQPETVEDTLPEQRQQRRNPRSQYKRKGKK